MAVVKEKNLQTSIQKLSWEAFREQVRLVNPEFSKLVDHLDPSSHFPIFQIKLPYGAKIIRRGRLYLPNTENQLVALEEHPNEDLRNNLSYAPIPLFMSLNKSCEVFIEADERSVPLHMLYPGQIWGYFIMPAPWDLTIGARTIFMLAKITDSHAHKRLCQELNLPYSLPGSIWEHGKIFAAIANSHLIKEKWHADLIFFSEPWLKALQSDPAWQQVRSYLQEQTFQHLLHLQHQSIMNMYAVLLNLQLTQASPKLRPYLLETAKHLLSIGNNAMPGFRVAGNSEIAAPIGLLEQVYTEIYELRDYLPIIMHPCYMEQDKNRSRYYSMATPTLLTGYPTTKTLPNIIQELRGVKQLLELFRNCLQNQKIYPELAWQAVKFDYFHSSPVPHQGIHSTQAMPEEDPNLLQTSKPYSNRIFPAAGPFVRGCIRIT